MVFSSVLFLLFFLPLFLMIYYILPRKLKNLFVLLSSIFFYSWGAPKFIFVILATTFVDFHLVKWMDEATSRFKRRLLLTLSVSINLGLLFYFKYFLFFLSNINELLSCFHISGFGWMKIILPIGISFYTFETITYVVDVYRRVHAPLKNFFDYQLYIILFPKLIAGPIIRYHEIADQITDRSLQETSFNRLSGFVRFCFGLSKKVLIANVVGEYADQVFSIADLNYNSTTAWLGILAYTFQIYFDFSGYSDMAIGIGQMIGFRFPENFNNPYTAQSITEFWRRWHITLGAWMRNYLYIPLGGNKVNSKYRLYFNLWLVFLASGLWHGASWNFIIWGAFHGFFLVAERAGLTSFYKAAGKLISVVLVFCIVLHGWIFFRIEGVQHALNFISGMYSFNSHRQFIEPKPEFFYILIIAAFISFINLSSFGKFLEKAIYSPEEGAKKIYITAFASVILFVLCIGRIAVSDFNPFIYFRF